MPTKRDVKAIISKQGLTGKEAARLIIHDLVETDHQRPQILTLAEVRQIRENVSRLTERDIQDFNSWLELYQIIGFTLQQAKVLHLEIRLELQSVESILEVFVTDYRLRATAAFVPTCVTEKQWQEQQALQREQKLQELHCLAEVIHERALWIGGRPAPGGGYEEPEEDLSDEEWSEITEQAWQEVQAALASHKLEPAALEEGTDPERIAAFGNEGFGAPEYHSVYLSGQELYETGLPEWQRWIDDYQTGMYEGSFGGNVFGEVAIVLQPDPSNLDERGWYREDWPEAFSGLNQLAKMSEEQGIDVRQAIQQRHQKIRKELRCFLAYQPVVETVSELVGVKLHEDLEQWLATIEEETEHYQQALERNCVKRLPALMRRHLSPKAQAFEKLRPDLPPFAIDDLKPDPGQIKHLQERMSLALSKEDYRQVCIGWLEEQSKEIEAIEERLAEEVSENGAGD
jgi:hypothetical protein